ncbi:MAG: YqgQ family protein, partial [Lacticaseibacillus paracasei]|nr:YqgQ family protein [Lacticaseibacillus paracasei]
LHKAQLIDDKVYLNAKVVLRHAHAQEEAHPLNHELPLPAEKRRNDKDE